MQNVDQKIWNQVAATGLLRSSWAKRMMAEVDEAKVAAAWEAWDKAHPDEDQTVLLAYEVILPLMAEPKAISVMIREEGDPALRGALPEVLNRKEGVRLATAEYRLTTTQQNRLMSLLPQTVGDLTTAWSPILKRTGVNG